jgi:hypothetical protein
MRFVAAISFSAINFFITCIPKKNMKPIYLIPLIILPVFLACSDSSSNAKNNSSSDSSSIETTVLSEPEEMIEPNPIEINFDFIQYIVDEKLPADASEKRFLKMINYGQVMEEELAYYFIDTFNLKLDSRLVIEYTLNETYAYLCVLENNLLKSKQLAFYDNAEGCYANSSIVYPDGKMEYFQYDCSESDSTFLVKTLMLNN